MVESPCAKVCIIDPDTDLCRGCARTLDEISRWSRMSDDEKRAVLAQLPTRPPFPDRSAA